MKAKPLPSTERLRSLFRYDPDSGVLYWRWSEERPRNWNVRFGARPAGCLVHGRFRVWVPEHGGAPTARVIWKIVHDEEPEIVDHIDGNPANDRLANLRAATPEQNMRNTRGRNRSGFKGITYNWRTKRWNATIRAEGRQIALESLASPVDAHEAYVRAAKRFYGEFARID